MPDTCILTGILIAPDGTAFGGARVVVRPVSTQPAVTVDGKVVAAVAADPVETGVDGAVTLALAPGHYRGSATQAPAGRSFSFDLSVPDLETALLADYIGSIDVEVQTSAQRARDEAVEAAGRANDAIAAGAAVVAGAVATIESLAEDADAARLAAQVAVTNAQAAGRGFATWAELVAQTAGVAGTSAEVLDSDIGTHTDPVLGGTVPNSGRYSWSVSPAGWRRIGATGLSAKVAKVEAAQERKTGPRTLDSTGSAWLLTRTDAAAEILWGIDLYGQTWSMIDGVLQRSGPYVNPYRPRYEYILDIDYPPNRYVGYGMPDPNTWLMFLGLDQSYGVGQTPVAGYDIIATPTPLDTQSWQIGQGSYAFDQPELDNYSTLEPLAGGTRTTALVTMAHYLQHHLQAIPVIGRQHPIICSTAAVGGVRIDQLRPGSQPFENAIYLIKTANGLVRAAGGRLEVHFVCMQGPQDAKELTSYETYQARFLDLVSALRKAAMDITGQHRPSYVYQTATDEFKGTDPAFAPHETACAQTDLEQRDPWIRFCGPLYPYERQEDAIPDRIHPSAKQGFVQLGETIGHAVLNSLFYPATPAFRIRRAWWAAGIAHAWSDLIVDYTTPVSIDLTGAQVNSSTLGAGRGIDVTDGPAGTPVAIESVAVEVSNTRRLRVTFASDPAAMKAPWLQVAHTRTPGPAPYDQHTGPVYGARSVIRETAPIALGVSDGLGSYVSRAVNLDGSPLGRPVYRWAPPQSLQLVRAI